MLPLLFLDFAMWLNPRFKVKVLKFVQDEMIKFRNLAGDAYPEMCKAVHTIIPENIFRDKIVALAKARGFVYPGSEIYGGLANSWDYGPLGSELKKILENKGIGVIHDKTVHDYPSYTNSYINTLKTINKNLAIIRFQHTIKQLCKGRFTRTVMS